MPRSISVFALVLLAAACGNGDSDNETAAAPVVDSAIAATVGDTVEDTTRAVGDTTAESAAQNTAHAVMRRADGREIGTLAIGQMPQGITVEGTVSGLPAGAHGTHFHAVGRCDPPFETAGPHWNPLNKQHGARNPAGPHLGDLPNLRVTPDGLVSVRIRSVGGTLRGANGLLDADGAALVIHESADDARTDPSGNSGARIACGVVTAGPAPES